MGPTLTWVATVLTAFWSSIVEFATDQQDNNNVLFTIASMMLTVAIAVFVNRFFRLIGSRLSKAVRDATKTLSDKRLLSAVRSGDAHLLKDALSKRVLPLPEISCRETAADCHLQNIFLCRAPLEGPNFNDENTPWLESPSGIYDMCNLLTFAILDAPLHCLMAIAVLLVERSSQLLNVSDATPPNGELRGQGDGVGMVADDLASLTRVEMSPLVAVVLRAQSIVSADDLTDLKRVYDYLVAKGADQKHRAVVSPFSSPDVIVIAATAMNPLFLHHAIATGDFQLDRLLDDISLVVSSNLFEDTCCGCKHFLETTYRCSLKVIASFASRSPNNDAALRKLASDDNCRSHFPAIGDFAEQCLRDVPSLKHSCRAMLFNHMIDSSTSAAVANIETSKAAHQCDEANGDIVRYTRFDDSPTESAFQSLWKEVIAASDCKLRQDYCQTHNHDHHARILNGEPKTFVGCGMCCYEDPAPRSGFRDSIFTAVGAVSLIVVAVLTSDKVLPLSEPSASPNTTSV